MPNIQVRNVPPKVHTILKRQAAHAGMSLSEFLLDEFRRLAATPSPSELVDRIRARTLYELPESSADIIRVERENR